MEPCPFKVRSLWYIPEIQAMKNAHGKKSNIFTYGFVDIVHFSKVTEDITVCSPPWYHDSLENHQLKSVNRFIM